MQRVACVLVVILAAACGGDAPDARGSAGPTVTDSAGVRIVEYDTLVPPLTLALSEPQVTIGAGDGVEFVDVAAALRLQDGRLMVVDRRRLELLLFAADGALEKTLGRQGGGPGEFQLIVSVVRHGDSVAVYDARQRRLAVFTADGVVRSVSVERNEYMFPITTALVGMLADGGFVVRAGAALALGAEGPPRLEREEWPVVRYDGGGHPVQRVLNVPGLEIEVRAIASGPRRGAFTGTSRVFGRTGIVALSGDQIIVADNGAFRFDVHDVDGRLRTSARVHVPPDSLTPAAIKSFVEARVAAIRDPARQSAQREYWEGASYPATAPVLDARMIVDALGRLWLGAYRRAGATERTWWVFAPSGEFIAQLAVPPNLTVTDAGDGYLVGIWRDQDDVQSVRVFTLVPQR